LTILNVPQGQQAFSYDCGIKALQLLMAYYGVEVPYETLFKSIKHHKIYGISNEGMARIARRHGFKVISKNDWTLDELKHQINARNPVVVAFQAWADKDLNQKDWKRAGIGDNEDWGHYAIVSGFKDGKVYFTDPTSFRRVWLSEREFKNRWHADNEYGYGLVLLGMIPANDKMLHIDADEPEPIKVSFDKYNKRCIHKNKRKINYTPSLARTK
jgi:ABC-type bacteriocin/lantibiotic exporter with double-glycine peptidase domain